MDRKSYTLCIAGHRYITKKNGGVELQTFYIGSLLQMVGWKVVYLCPNSSGKFGYEKINNQYEIYWYYPYSFGFQISRKSIEQMLDQIRPDVIYQRGRTDLVDKKILVEYCKKREVPLALSLSSDADLSLWSGTKTVLKSPKPLYKKIPLSLYSILTDLAFYQTLKQATYLIAQHETQQELINHVLKRHSSILRTIHKIAENDINKEIPLKVIWVTNYRPWKQGELFLELAKYFENTEYQFYMILGKTKPEYINDIITAAKSFTNITLLNELPVETIENLLSKSAVFINTSLPEEGFPNTFVQAWLRETPVISLNVDPGGVLEREKIGICCHGNFNLMKRTLKYLLDNNEKRIAMGKSARLYAERVHGFETNRYIYDRFFRAVAERKPIETLNPENSFEDSNL